MEGGEGAHGGRLLGKRGKRAKFQRALFRRGEERLWRSVHTTGGTNILKGGLLFQRKRGPREASQPQDQRLGVSLEGFV